MTKAGKFRESVKRELKVRTEIQHRCPKLRRLRRVGICQLREFGKLAT